MNIPDGARVRHSDGQIQPYRDMYLGEGNCVTKATKKRWMEEKMAQRGTLIRHVNGDCADYVEVLWDDNCTTQCLEHMITAL